MLQAKALPITRHDYEEMPPGLRLKAASIFKSPLRK